MYISNLSKGLFVYLFGSGVCAKKFHCSLKFDFRCRNYATGSSTFIRAPAAAAAAPT